METLLLVMSAVSTSVSVSLIVSMIIYGNMIKKWGDK